MRDGSILGAMMHLMLLVFSNITKLNLEKKSLHKYCICGHLKKEHGIRTLAVERPHILGICWTCRYAESRETQINSVHNFKLDNLSYIEELAKKRKLI